MSDTIPPQDNPEAEEPEVNPLVTIDDFAKIKLVIADVVSAEKIENTDKLMKLALKIGEEERTIISGIANVYTAEELTGRQIVLFANLQPRKMRGVLSQGMLLAASDEDGNAILLMPDKPVKSGTGIR